MTSFYARLSALFLIVTCGLVLVIGWLSLDAATAFVDETEQKLNSNLATVMAVDFEPFLADSIDHAAIEEKIAYFIGVNPRIDIYLLGSNGMIKAHFVESGREPVRPVLETVSMDAMMAGAPLPILGPDPLSETRQKPFSVAALEIMGEPECYLYVVLGSERYDSAAAAVQDSYILSTLTRGFALALLAALAAGLLLFAILTRPLRALGQAVGEFADGDYSRRANVTGGDEVGQLAGAFNDMADQLETNVKDLENTDRLRRELVANVSHDLRSPLASIQGYLETILIKLETAKTEDLRGFVEVALSGSRRMGRLITQLFELSKLDANQVRLEPEAFSLLDLLQDVSQQFLPRAEKHGVFLTVNLPDHAPLVRGDIALVERAISNLIDNAIRHTPIGGSVTLTPTVDGDAVHVQVADTGVGIPADQLPRIFDRFYRVDESRYAQSPGAGLGLAITKKILDLHRATLSVRSELNRGTTFSFALPVWQSEPALALG